MTSPTIKAQRRTIYPSDIALEVAMLPDGSYCLSQTQVTAAIEKHHSSFAQFFRSKCFKSWQGFDSGLRNFITSAEIEGSNLPIASISIEAALVYWFKWAEKGNSLARALVIALAKQSLYDRADAAFGVSRHQSERSSALAFDVSDAGAERIATTYQSLEQPFYPQVEAQIGHELKLKIRLAELELEQEKLKRSRSNNTFPATDISRIGVPPWQVIPWAQQTLGWACWTDAARLLTKLGYGYKTTHWFKLRISGEVWIMPPDSFNSLKAAIEQFKSSRS